jgi:hypothetical protein
MYRYLYIYMKFSAVQNCFNYRFDFQHLLSSKFGNFKL